MHFSCPCFGRAFIGSVAEIRLVALDESAGTD